MVSENEIQSYTQAEMEEMADYLGYGAEGKSQKHNVHTFLFNVATAKDTTKLGYLREDEVGLPSHPIRTYKTIANISNNIMGNTFLAEYFLNKSEIVTSTSLSRNAKLINLAVVQKREMSDTTPLRAPNKGWFKKKDKKEEET